MANNTCPGCGRVILVHGDAGEDPCSPECREEMESSESQLRLGLVQDPVFPEPFHGELMNCANPHLFVDEEGYPPHFGELCSPWELMMSALFMQPKRLRALSLLEEAKERQGYC